MSYIKRLIQLESLVRLFEVRIAALEEGQSRFYLEPSSSEENEPSAVDDVKQIKMEVVN